MNKSLSSRQRMENTIFSNQYPQRNTSRSVATGLEFMGKTGRGKQHESDTKIQRNSQIWDIR